MYEERTGKCLPQVEHIRGHIRNSNIGVIGRPSLSDISFTVEAVNACNVNLKIGAVCNMEAYYLLLSVFSKFWGC
jgi:hypothetical protein